MTVHDPAAGQPAASPLVPPGIDATFAGLDLLDPGVVLVCDWRPEPGQPRPEPHLVTCYGAVAGKR